MLKWPSCDRPRLVVANNYFGSEPLPVGRCFPTPAGLTCPPGRGARVSRRATIVPKRLSPPAVWLVRRVSQLPCCCPEPLAVVVTDPNELDSDTAVRNIRSDESVTHYLAVTAWQGESDADPSPDLERMARLDKRAPDPKDSQRAAGRLVSIEPALLDLCPDHGAEFYARVSPMSSCMARRVLGRRQAHADRSCSRKKRSWKTLGKSQQESLRM